MTLQELYQEIGGDYEQALRVLRIEKLVDKHIRKFTSNTAVAALLSAQDTMDPEVLFENAHAVKGITANLGLNGICAVATEISEEFRPGRSRKLSDEEVREKLDGLREIYEKTTAGIRSYDSGA